MVALWIEKTCSGKNYILYVGLGIGLGVGHYSTRVGPLPLGRQAARSPDTGYYVSSDLPFSHYTQVSQNQYLLKIRDS